MKTTIEECKDFFESIMCLCVEGPEFHTKMELVDAICQEATKGYDLCRSSQQADSPDAKYPHKDCFYSGGRGCSNLNLGAKLRRQSKRYSVLFRH